MHRVGFFKGASGKRQWRELPSSTAGTSSVSSTSTTTTHHTPSTTSSVKPEAFPAGGRSGNFFGRLPSAPPGLSGVSVGPPSAVYSPIGHVTTSHNNNLSHANNNIGSRTYELFGSVDPIAEPQERLLSFLPAHLQPEVLSGGQGRLSSDARVNVGRTDLRVWSSFPAHSQRRSFSVAPSTVSLEPATKTADPTNDGQAPPRQRRMLGGSRDRFSTAEQREFSASHLLAEYDVDVEAIDWTLEGELAAIPDTPSTEVYKRIRLHLDQNPKCHQKLVRNVFRFVETELELNLAFHALDLTQLRLVETKEETAAVVVKACCRVNQPERALAALSNPLNYRLWPSAATLNYLLVAFSLAGDHENVLRTFSLFKRRRMQPSLKTYTNVIRSCVLAGDAHAALDFARKAQSPPSSFVLDRTAYNLLMRACTESSLPEEAVRLREEMEQKGVKANQYTNRIAVVAHLLLSDVSSALPRFTELLSTPPPLPLPEACKGILEGVARDDDASGVTALSALLSEYRALGHDVPSELLETVESAAASVSESVAAAEADNEGEGEGEEAEEETTSNQ